MPILPPKIILYGIPGSGKDTHGNELSQLLGIPHFSIGQILRDEIASGSEIGQYIKGFHDTGALVPGTTTTEILLKRLQTSELQRSGYIINGYPRTEEDFRYFFAHETPTHVLHLMITDELARTRMMKRGRSDDTPELITARIARYHTREKAVCELIRTTTSVPVIEVDSSGTPSVVTQSMVECLPYAGIAGSGNYTETVR
jgi:adenylate kinase